MGMLVIFRFSGRFCCLELLRPGLCFLLLAFCHAGSVSIPFSKMSANKDAASSSVAGQSGKEASGEVHAKKSVDKLNVREFYERFCIPNGMSVQLVDGEAVSTEKSTDNSIFFTKEQFNAGLRFPLSSLFREFLHFTQIPPAYIHPNIVRVLMRCNILSMLLPGPFIVGGPFHLLHQEGEK